MKFNENIGPKLQIGFNIFVNQLGNIQEIQEVIYKRGNIRIWQFLTTRILTN